MSRYRPICKCFDCYNPEFKDTKPLTLQEELDLMAQEEREHEESEEFEL